MKNIRIFGIAFLAVAFFAVSATAQKKPTKKTTAKKPAPATTSSIKTVQPLEVRTAREKVDIQLANVNRFIEVMGPIVQGIETLDQSAKTKKLPKATLDRNEDTKQKLTVAIRNLKDGLATLESEFRTKTTLQKYLTTIQGITDLAAKSEDMAIAGKFVASKEPLRELSKKLTDTLMAIPL